MVELSVAVAAEPSISSCEEAFHRAWPRAVTVFSPYTRLLPPILCRNGEQERQQGLSASFAMIRMHDERIVIGLQQVLDRHLQDHAFAILAHEVGHYVHAPGTLVEHVRLHDRVRRCLPANLVQYAGVVANLYTDLLLNDRLMRSCGVDIAAVYATLRSDGEVSRLWAVYMRMYERLWALRSGTLVTRPAGSIDADAELGARIVRLFRRQWMDGAGPFTLLIAPYFEDLAEDQPPLPGWLDTAATEVGGVIPDGLTEDDFDPDDLVHPALDERIAGGSELDNGDEDDAEGTASGSRANRSAARAKKGDGRRDKRKVVRGPQQYVAMLRAMGVSRTPRQMVARYYRELALAHIIPFPTQRIERSADPLLEGLDLWEPGNELGRIDWLQTLLRSPLVIPGVTTVERSYGESPGGEPERRPPDLYVGIDCSGSMGNPAYQLAHPVLAGVVLTLSALRAGARVMACLSGEWLGRGQHTETADFIRDEDAILGVLTDYLGTGASFGLPRLAQTFADQPARKRPAHILLVSDTDLFGEIDGTTDGWQIARRAVERAGGGATAVLRLSDHQHHQQWLEKLQSIGFSTHCVSSEEQLVDFAKAFARRTFAFQERGG